MSAARKTRKEHPKRAPSQANEVPTPYFIPPNEVGITDDDDPSKLRDLANVNTFLHEYHESMKICGNILLTFNRLQYDIEIPKDLAELGDEYATYVALNVDKKKVSVNKNIYKAVKDRFRFILDLVKDGSEEFMRKISDEMKRSQKVEDIVLTSFVYLDDDSPQKPYVDLSKTPEGRQLKQRYENDICKYNGRRKLVCMDFYFITDGLDKIVNDPLVSINDTILVYIGAAPGSHIQMIHNYFSNIEFLLYDPQAFDPELVRYAQEHKGVSIVQKIFTDDDANELKAKYEGKNILFISDIRNVEDTGPRRAGKVTSKMVHGDMEDQQRWVKILNPYYSMLKFKLPYPGEMNNNDTYEYLDGKIIFQCWEKGLSSETRLLVSADNENKMKQYSLSKYEKQIFYFQTVTRLQKYTIPFVDQKDGFVNIYDYAMEYLILNNIMKLYKSAVDVDLLKNSITQYSKGYTPEAPSYSTYMKFKRDFDAYIENQSRTVDDIADLLAGALEESNDGGRKDGGRKDGGSEESEERKESEESDEDVEKVESDVDDVEFVGDAAEDENPDEQPLVPDIIDINEEDLYVEEN